MESEQVTPVDSIKDIGTFMELQTEFTKHLKKAEMLWK